VVSAVKREVSPREWERRVELAACYRLVALQGWNHSVHNNITTDVPGESGAFLVNPLDLVYEEITASSLIKVDADGRTLFNPNPAFAPSLAGFAAHSVIHVARPDLACLVHTHSPAGMALSALRCGFLPLHQTILRFSPIAYHDFEGMAIAPPERQRLAQRMKDTDAMVLRHHGLLAGGRSVAEAFANIRRLEHAAAAQLLAASMPQEVEPISSEVIELTRGHLAAAAAAPQPPQGISREWSALLRSLDRLDPGFRD